MQAAKPSGLWRAPHLALFLLASLWAALVPLIWLWPDLVCDPVAWHRQELVLGVAGAAMGGYLLTALPHWIRQAGGRPAPNRARGQGVTRLLVLAWVIGRLAGGPCLPDAVALVGQTLYPLGLVAALALPVLAARAWGRLPIALAPFLLVLIALRLRLAADNQTAVLGMALLVALVGGRIIPAFLQARAGQDTAMRGRLPLVARLADLALALALAVPLIGVPFPLTRALLLAAAVGQALRLVDWPLARGLRGGQADLAVLVIAWAWMPLGLGLMAGGLGVFAALSPSTALHAVTMGLMGSMILAVMARAWMPRVPGALRLGRMLGVAFSLVQIATLLRLGLPLDPRPAALCWIAGWALASLAAIAAVFRPLPRPVLSAQRGTSAWRPIAPPK